MSIPATIAADPLDELPQEASATGRVLVVDDDRLSRSIHRTFLAAKFDVTTAVSGQEALERCKVHLPDLILLDVDMPEMDGYETCRKLREFTAIPIVFITAHTSMEEHLRAYDAGGNSLFTKPVHSDILVRTVTLAIEQYRKTATLADEKRALEKMAMGFLNSVSQSSALLDFTRSSLASQEYGELAEHLRRAVQQLGLSCSVRINHPGGPTVVTDHGAPTPLELSIFEHVSEIGRLFQFKNRLVINYDRASIIVSNMPDESEDPQRAGLLRDSLNILAEAAEVVARNIDQKKAARQNTRQMRTALVGAEEALNRLGEQHRRMLHDVRLLLQDQVDEVERAFTWLNISQNQEAAIAATMNQSTQRVLDRLSNGDEFETGYELVMASLHAGRGAKAPEACPAPSTTT
ncbi:MAG: response regulator [Rhodocyclales bacterium GT-UBC]|nr:MAG: response regulator [Rhodocyclales bacterium GT-UBC]